MLGILVIRESTVVVTVCADVVGHSENVHMIMIIVLILVMFYFPAFTVL